MTTKRMYGSYESETFDDNTRRCVFCGHIKPLEEFHKNGKDAQGNTVYRLDCKTCYNIRRNDNRRKKAHSDFLGNQRRRGEENPNFTHQDWKSCLIYFGGACAYCGSTPRKGQRLTKDHLVSVSQNGRTVPENIVPACQSCNSSKGAEDFKDWLMKQPFFSQDRLNKIFKWRSIMRQASR